jgi:glycosyltransferase involved in cell wall biosynthesis
MSKITHLMPVKDGFNYLPTSVANIRANSNLEDEIIIIDDGSTDKSTNYLSTIELKVPNLRVIYTKGIGLVNALNLGIRESSNNWIARYDVDDTYPSYRVAKQKKLISSDVAAIFCDYKLVTHDGKASAIIPSAIDNLATIVSLLYSQQTPHPGVLLNREIIISVGGYLSNDFPVEDLSLWLRAARSGKLVSVPEVLLNYTLSNLSTSGSRQKIVKTKKLEIIKKYGLPLDVIQDSASELSDTYLRYVNSPFVEERRILLLRNLRKLYKMQPEITKVIVPGYFEYIALHPIKASGLVQQKFRRFVYRNSNL